MKPNIKLKTVGILKEIAILRAENKVLKTMIEDANNRESGRAGLSRATEAMKAFLEINDFEQLVFQRLHLLREVKV